MVVVPEHALISHKLTRLRDVNSSSMLFRNLASEITQVLVAEATRDLLTVEDVRNTPLESFSGQSLAHRIGIVPILRAGLGMSDAAHKMLPMARVLHVGLYRDEETLEPVYYYDKLPTPPNIDLALVVDPMLATGGSAIAAVSRLKETGITDLRFLGLIAAPEGIAAFRAAHPDVKIWMAAIDEKLDENGYIVPGLGDAGDRIMDSI
ncbi:MAG: uracil phosphoribosyltransferase [Methanobacteriota archaeon]|nr:MAG: uracil phosphoribosyltransferase [Euryarchaeota archaeon]PXY79649.1 MAG: uracil phosphoribosyltransferase [Euryarchaeota archaeon]HIA25385.1 uracil phosphoribosyltransferase [Candidatus Poseidoniales archaeon]HIB41992.1 uracil phosphoribosyltransferase [Candidatus Poseidoniales archaeon]